MGVVQWSVLLCRKICVVQGMEYRSRMWQTGAEEESCVCALKGVQMVSAGHCFTGRGTLKIRPYYHVFLWNHIFHAPAE